MTSILSLIYSFNDTPAAPPTGNQVRFDASFPYRDVTKIFIRYLTVDGIDAKPILLAIPVGATIVVQDKDDSGVFGKFQTTGVATDAGTYVTIPATYVDNGLAMVNGQALVAVILADAAGTPTPPALVGFDLAKAHLQITDNDHDAEIQSKLNQASAIIVDYLKDRADAGWSDGSVAVPDVVQTAVLFMLAHLWIHRGDDFANAVDTELWNAIDRLLMRRRDPAFA